MGKPASVLLALSLAMALSGCATRVSRSACHSGEQNAIMDSLYFGASMPESQRFLLCPMGSGGTAPFRSEIQ